MYPFKVPAIKIEQPLGIFFILSLPASLLLDTCHSIKAEILDEDDDVKVNAIGKVVDRIKGTQRERKETRLDEIKRYSESVDACFPNAIILGANYNESGELVTDEDKRWFIEEVTIDGKLNDDFYYLTIPSEAKLASIIDGQHRVFGFEKSNAKDMRLLCSVFIDLPMPYHAELFTKINTTQKRVDKNLAYNLFQFDMALGSSETWSPETLSVYFSRVLASDEKSPLKGIIKLGVSGINTDSSISMASIIDGILSLITSNAERDRSELHRVTIDKGRNREMLINMRSNAPLRALYLNNKDKTLYEIIHSYFEAIQSTLWEINIDNDIFKKTLGVHACFDILKEITTQNGVNHSYSKDFFINLLHEVEKVDFNTDFYGVQTKMRTRIKNTIFLISGLKNIESIKCSDDDKAHLLDVVENL